MLGKQSSASEFCLLGFPGSQELHHVLFATFFFFYLITVMGNTVIIMTVCFHKDLQSPMHFFLSHLSVLEIMTISTAVPLMLWGFLLPGMQRISLTACFAQLYLYLSLGTTEFVLMAAMAVDRYVTVCNPLRYSVIMNSCTCIWVVSVSWVFEFLFKIWPVYATFQLSFCKSNVVDHFFCDKGQLLNLSCDDTLFTEFIHFLMAVFIIIGSLIPTIVSYTYIIFTILKIPSASGQRKAFSTCASHFTCVVIGCGSCMFLYVKPKQMQAAEYNRVVSLLVLVVTPFLNPFIFTLQNEKFMEAFQDGMKRCHQLIKD
ncbi:putative olfactory receptor 9A1 [Choloepus didactylus]|uniref:putative olfactory receptor 9A1 n=1 Tax=Choloepus didactylus TaxID=27675 RepID=UPI00189D1EEE|nr:putative olfactory receptor 9A1 [Choloepus didactylus]